MNDRSNQIKQAIDTLKARSVNDLCKEQIFKDWLFDDLIPGCDKDTRSEIRSSLSLISGHRRTKKRKSNSEPWCEDLARQYKKTSRKGPQHVISALQDLWTNLGEVEAKLQAAPHIHDGFWKTRTCLVEQGSRADGPLRRLLQTYRNAEANSFTGDLGRRLLLLLLDYQIDEIMVSGEDEDVLDNRPEVERSVEKLAVEHAVEPKLFRSCRDKASGLHKLIDRWGIGVLLMIGRCDLYESRLSKADHDFMWNYCASDANLSKIVRRANSYNSVVGAIIREGLEIHGIVLQGFLHSDGRFPVCYRRDIESVDCSSRYARDVPIAALQTADQPRGAAASPSTWQPQPQTASTDASLHNDLNTLVAAAAYAESSLETGPTTILWQQMGAEHIGQGDNGVLSGLWDAEGLAELFPDAFGNSSAMQ